uniref:Uncharacterized protein n=1 Tax=Romanomermis culicivorax TaxID=13658 RepID=A0A915KN60_ROMCU
MTGHILFPTTSAILYTSTVIYANEVDPNSLATTNISHYEAPSPQSRLLSKGEAYLYGTLAVLVVSLLSLTGAAILPILDKKMAYRASMLTFMALAVGTMTSDAFLHMIPEDLKFN